MDEVATPSDADADADTGADTGADTDAGTDAAEASPSEDDARPNGRWDRYDSLIAGAVAIVTFFVHPLHLILSRPYWLDEAWLAALTRASIWQLPSHSALAPFGFVALLRLIPGSGPQRARLVVLVFSAATVVIAYVLGRGRPWTSKSFARIAGIGAALVVMLAPLSLVRNDLKAYTCDAFCALVIFGVALRIERPPGDAPVWLLAVASVVALPFSSTSAFVSAAAFAGLLGAAWFALDGDRVVEVLITGGATGVALAAYFGVVVIPSTNAMLRDYWDSYYLSGSAAHILHESWQRLTQLRVALGMPTFAFIVLFLLGIAVLWTMQARSVAIAVPFLWGEMLLAGRLRRYPFLDLRTSTFLLVSSLLVCTIGAAGVVHLLYRLDRRVGGAIALVLAGSFVAGNATHIDKLNIPYEDVRSQTDYVAEHRTANDVILVNQTGSFGFAFYWPGGNVSITRSDEVGEGFLARVDGLNAIYVSGRTYPTVLAALSEALDRMRAAGPDSHVFIVRSHVNHDELVGWRESFELLGVQPRSIHTGTEPLLEIGPA